MTDHSDPDLERPPSVEPVRRTVRPEETIPGYTGYREYSDVDERGNTVSAPAAARSGLRSLFAAIVLVALAVALLVLGGLAAHAIAWLVTTGWEIIG